MVTIQIKEDSLQAKQFIKFAKTLPFATVDKIKKATIITKAEKTYLSDLKIALNQVKNGDTKSLDEILNEI